MKEHFTTETAIPTSNKHNDRNVTNKEIQLTQTVSNAQKCTSNVTATQIVPTIAMSTSSKTTSWITSGKKDQSALIRKTLIAIIAICFGIYGVVLFFLVFNHFDRSIPYCSSIVDELTDYIKAMECS